MPSYFFFRHSYNGVFSIKRGPTIRRTQLKSDSYPPSSYHYWISVDKKKKKKLSFAAFSYSVFVMISADRLKLKYNNRTLLVLGSKRFDFVQCHGISHPSFRRELINYRQKWQKVRIFKKRWLCSWISNVLLTSPITCVGSLPEYVKSLTTTFASSVRTLSFSIFFFYPWFYTILT